MRTSLGLCRSAFFLRKLKAPIHWCGREDSNFHGLPHSDLNAARLPIPPRPHRGEARGLAKVSPEGKRGRAAPSKGRQRQLWFRSVDTLVCVGGVEAKLRVVQ